MIPEGKIGQSEIIGAASHGAGWLIVHKWRPAQVIGDGSGSRSVSYTSNWGAACTGSVMDIGPNAKKCRRCFKPATPEPTP